jgi:hypothetical protein
MVGPDEMNKDEQDLVLRTLRPITQQQMDDIMKGTRDTINPQHYKNGEIECIDAIKAATVNKPGIQAVCVANVIKYLWRYESKNRIEDVRKAHWYLERLIKEMEKNDAGSKSKESGDIYP